MYVISLLFCLPNNCYRKSIRASHSAQKPEKNPRRVIHIDFGDALLVPLLFSRVFGPVGCTVQCVMARVKKINVAIYDDLAPWKLFSDKFLSRHRGPKLIAHEEIACHISSWNRS